MFCNNCALWKKIDYPIPTLPTEITARLGICGRQRPQVHEEGGVDSAMSAEDPEHGWGNDHVVTGPYFGCIFYANAHSDFKLTPFQIEALKAMAHRDKIGAIKALRSHTGCDLIDAKRYIDTL